MRTLRAASMKPMCSYVALKCVYVKQRSSQAMACLSSEMLVSPYMIKTMQIIFLIFFSQNVCRQITIF